MATFSLEQHGISVGTIIRNASPAALYEAALRHERGSAISSTGALVALSGERTGRSFQLGGKVRVQVARVDLDDRKIDLEMIESKPPKKAKKAKPAKERKRNGNKPAKKKGKGKGKTGLRRRY